MLNSSRIPSFLSPQNKKCLHSLKSRKKRNQLENRLESSGDDCTSGNGDFWLQATLASTTVAGGCCLAAVAMDTAALTTAVIVPPVDNWTRTNVTWCAWNQFISKPVSNKTPTWTNQRERKKKNCTIQKRLQCHKLDLYMSLCTSRLIRKSNTNQHSFGLRIIQEFRLSTFGLTRTHLYFPYKAKNKSAEKTIPITRGWL